MYLKIEIMGIPKNIKKNKGFFLFEILLALTLLGFVSTLIATIFYSGLKVYKKSRELYASYRVIFVALDRIEKELEDMVYFDFSRSLPLRRVFEGKRNEISFLLGDNDGLKVVRYFLLPREESNFFSLVRQEIKFLDYIQGRYDEQAGVRILKDSFLENGLRFFYCVESLERKNCDFKESWPEDRFPAIIRVQFVLASCNGEKTIEKDIFIPSGYVGGRRHDD